MNSTAMIPRREVLLVVAATILFAIIFIAIVPPTYGLTGDPEHYVGLARAIAAGDSYAINGMPEVRFPPGLPMLLAPAAWLFDGSFAAISRWAAALASLALLLIWLYARRQARWLAFSIAILTVCSVPFLSVATGNPMSEPVFLALTMGLLLWAERDWAGTPGRNWLGVLTGCLLLVALPAVRTIGIAAVAAGGVVFVAGLRSSRPGGAPPRFRDVLPVASGVLFLVGWFVWAQTHQVAWYAGAGGGGYLEKILLLDPHHPDLGPARIGDLIGRVIRNLVIQSAHAGELFAPVPWVKPVWYSPVMIAVPLLVAGWWRELRGPGRFGAVYVFLYLGIVFLWPYDEASRFLLPVAPLLWIYLFEGVRQLGRVLREGWGPIRMLSVLWCAAGLAGVTALAQPAAESLSRQDLAAGAFWTVALFGLAAGWRHLVGLARRWNARPTLWVSVAGTTLFAVVSIAQAGPMIVQRARGATPKSSSEQSLREAARWISANTSPEAIIQTTYETRINFATGRRAVPLPVTLAPGPFLEIDRRYRPTLVVVLESNEGYVEPNDSARFEVLQRLFPGRWHLLHRREGARIYGTR